MNINKIILSLSVIVFAFAGLTVFSNSQWTAANSIICPQGTTRYKTTTFCSDNTNIYGSFPQKIIDLCVSRSVKGSTACTNVLTFKTSFNGTVYNTTMNRYSLSFYNSFAGSSFCPTGTWVINADQLCSDGTNYYGSFSNTFVAKCLQTLAPDNCLENRVTIANYNTITSAGTTTNPAPTPTPTPILTPTPTPTPTPTNPNQYNTSLLKQEVVRSITPNSADYFNNWEGFDYSGNLKQVYDKNHQSFNGNEITISASKKWTPNPAYNPSSTDPRYSTEGASYGGGQLMLKERLTRGYVSFEAKLPNFVGAMPAIWLLNRDNPNFFSEIDCFEVPGSEVNNVYSVTHYGTKLSTIKTDYKYKKVSNLSTQYHKFEIYKTADKVVTLIDGELLYERSMKETLSNGINGLNVPMELIFNFNIGDKWSGTTVKDSMLPYDMKIRNLKVDFYK